MTVPLLLEFAEAGDTDTTAWIDPVAVTAVGPCWAVGKTVVRTRCGGVYQLRDEPTDVAKRINLARIELAEQRRARHD